MEQETGKVPDQVPITWVDYLNIGVSLVLGFFLVWTAIDTMRMIHGEEPEGGPGTPVSTPVDAPGENSGNSRVRLVKDSAHDTAS